MAIAEKIGDHHINRAVVSEALSGSAHWSKLARIVEALGGDLERVESLWHAAHPDSQVDNSSGAPRQRPSDVSQEPSRASTGIDLGLFAQELRRHFREQPFILRGQELPLPPETPTTEATKPRSVAPPHRNPASRPDPSKMSAAELVGYIIVHEPNAARSWGWISHSTPKPPEKK